MNDEHSRIRTLKQRWDEDDAARDKQEERAQRSISHVLARIGGLLKPAVYIVRRQAASRPRSA